jgi:hypothetical protein
MGQNVITIRLRGNLHFLFAKTQICAPNYLSNLITSIVKTGLNGVKTRVPSICF